MKIVIHRGELSPYEEATHLSVDYMHNSLMGWYKGSEYQVYNFIKPIFNRLERLAYKDKLVNHIGRLDNRNHSYNISEEGDIIVIEFTH